MAGLAGCDGHPRDTAMAWVRRAHVATELARLARSTPGWRDHGITRQQGCYEFTVGDDLAVRLATDVDATPGPPATGSLFALGSLARHDRDRVLIRLRGIALSAPIIDIAALSVQNTVEWHIPMLQIAQRSTSVVPTPQAVALPKAKITLPAHRKPAADSVVGA